MKQLASLAVALICFLPLVTAVYIGHPGFYDRNHIHRSERHPVNTDSDTQVVEQHGVVLAAGDQAEITEQGQTVTITRVSTEPHKFAPLD